MTTGTTADTTTSTSGLSATDTDSTTTTTGDTTTGSTTGPNCDGMGGEENALSVIWIANSQQGTVSKIDTIKAANSGEYGAPAVAL